jgi:hypothetical protein
MLHKCANPSCNRTFRGSRSGALFLFEPRACHMGPDTSLQEYGYRIEPFWLCEECAANMTIISDTGETPVIIPLDTDCEQIGTA